jgi:hypothetical protein
MYLMTFICLLQLSNHNPYQTGSDTHEAEEVDVDDPSYWQVSWSRVVSELVIPNLHFANNSFVI